MKPDIDFINSVDPEQLASDHPHCFLHNMCVHYIPNMKYRIALTFF